MAIFALNQMTMAHATTRAVLDVAQATGCVGVELRNDLGLGLFDGLAPEIVGAEARANGLRILALAEVYGFNDDTAQTRQAVRDLVQTARACGSEAVVLIPRMGNAPMDRAAQKNELHAALSNLIPILDGTGVTALIEPLGFANSSLRFKADVADVLHDLGNPTCFGLIHDTFHHALAGETDVFADLTRIVHVSGVEDPTVAVSDMTDAHRGLVDADDRLGSADQIEHLTRAGYDGPLSFEAFSPDVHALNDPTAALLASTTFITSRSAEMVA